MGAHPKKLNGLLTYTIASSDGSSQATIIPEFGGTLSSIIMAGIDGPRELLFLHDFFWDKNNQQFPGGSPFCFPVCGRVERAGNYGQYLYAGTLYELPIHGFAWQRAWTVDDYTQDTITISLLFDNNTLKVYPFQFKVTLHYEIKSNQLTCEQTYSNGGDQPLPYNAGFHPYFLTDMPNQGKEHTQVNLRANRRFVYNDSLTDLIGEQPLLEFPTVITNPNINEQLFALSDDKSLSLLHPNGDYISMHTSSLNDPNFFPYAQLYTIAEKPFICIEPWMGAPNAINTVQGMRWLAPGEQESAIFNLSMRSM